MSSGRKSEIFLEDTERDQGFPHKNITGETLGTKRGMHTAPITSGAKTSTDNSTTTPLDASGTFTGTGENVSTYPHITVACYSDVAGSFTVEWSNDNTNWRADGDTYNVSAANLTKVTYGRIYPYFRAIYTNGTGSQTTFELVTIYDINRPKPSTHKLSEGVGDSTDAEMVKAVLTGRDQNNSYRNTTVTSNGSIEALDVAIQGPLSAFGELSTASITPTVQFDATSGGTESPLLQIFTATGGSVGVKTDHGGKEFMMSTGTSVGGYGLIRSKRLLRYRPGQGARMRFTARYSSPVTDCIQRAGGINVGTELSFGYNGGSDFGLLYRTGGRQEVWELEITTPAGGAENATLTLDGTAYTIALTNATAATNAYEIASDGTYSTTHDGWQNGDKVIFNRLNVGDATGTYSFTSATAVGTFTKLSDGVDVTDTFVAESDWNINTLSTASDPFILDPQKGNVFQITYQYLGYGAITYWIEDPESGVFIPVHRIAYSNANTVPNLETPILRIGWACASLGSSTDTTLYGASAAGFIDGPVIFNKLPAGHGNTKNVGTTLTNIIQFRVRPVFNNFVNLAEVFPILASFAVDGTKPAEIEVHLNPTVAGTPNWTYHKETTQLMEYDTAGTTISTDTEIAVIPVAKTGNASVDLERLRVRLERGDVVCLAARATSGTTDCTASLTWLED